MTLDKEGKFVENKDGFVVKTRDPERQKWRDQFKIPRTCPCCGRLTENWDNSALLTYGVCSDCHIDFIDGRTLPEKLASPNRNKEDMVKWVKQKWEEKEKRKNNI